MCLGLFSHRRVYTGKSSVATFFLVWYHDVTVRTRGPRRLATVSRMGATITTGRRLNLIPRSDQGLRCTDEDAQTKTEVKRLRIEHY